MLYDMNIGKNIRAVLDELGISQGELSRLTGIPLRTISSWLNSEEPNPGFQYVSKIADALQVTPGFIADYGNLEGQYRNPQTWKAKREVATALLADIARKYPYGPEAKALAVLESHELDPPGIQEACGKVRQILLSGVQSAVEALKGNIEAFLEFVETKEKLPPPREEVMPRKVG